MENRKFYISGRITGLSESSYTYNFNRAKYILSSRFPDAEVINPLDIPSYKNGNKWSDFLRNDIVAICDCTDLYYMSNWYRSKGVIFEMFVAFVLGLNVKLLKFELAR